jgi:hypothetical protein
MWGALSDKVHGSAGYNCCWSSPMQSFLGPSPAAVSDSRLPQPGRPGRRIYIPHEQGGMKYPSGAYDQMFITVRPLRGLLIWGAHSDERTDALFTRVTVSSSKSIVSMYNLHFTCY